MQLPCQDWSSLHGDLQILNFNPIQRGVVFKTPESPANFIHHLKTSLSRTLLFFPPLAGRLATEENDDDTVSFFVDCNNAGAKFVHAIAASVSVSDILEPKRLPHDLVFPLFRLNGSRNLDGTSKPLLGVKVTELVDGVFISCAANQAVIDGTSFWHFFKSWSEISRGLPTISKILVFQRWFPDNGDRPIRLPRSLSENHALRPPPSSPLVWRFFQFSKQELAKLKAKDNSEAGHTDKLSSLQSLSAHLWRRYTRGLPDPRPRDGYSTINHGRGCQRKNPSGGGLFRELSTYCCNRHT